VYRFTLLVAMLGLAVGLVGCDFGGDDESSGGSTGSSGTQGGGNTQALETFDEGEWGTFGYSYQMTRHVPADEITKDNVGQMGLSWSVDFKKEDPDVPLGQQTFPVVVDGTLYATTHFNHIFAMDAKTGEVKWHYKPSAIGAFKNFGLSNNRGVAYCDGKVYMLTLDMRIIAVDAATGKQAMEVPIYRDVKDAKPEFGYYETTAPVCYKGILLIGSSGADNGVRGFFMGYNAKDLSPAWANPYWTIPPEGQDWRAKGRFHGGGASWMPPAVDPDTDTAYFSSSNPSPDFFAALRPGPNPKTNSVIAVDAMTGKEKWWRQQLAPDEWDYDTAQGPQVFEATIDGSKKKVVSIATKEGVWFAYDAETGDPVYERVNLLDRNEHPALKPGEPVDVYPSSLGGVNYAPAGYDPDSNLVINTTVESKTTLIQAQTEADVERNRVRGDVDTGAVNGFGTTPKGWHDYGSVVAVDLDSGEQKWKIKDTEPVRSGVTLTSAGIGFYGSGNGELRAFDTETGEVLWKYQTGAQLAAAPTIYTVDGKQYVAVSVGGTFTSSLGGTASRVDVFALGGKPSTASPPQLPGKGTGVEPTAEGGGGEQQQQFLTMGQKPKTLGLSLLAADGTVGGGLNFNGYNRGGMTITIPQGWTVNATFKNLAVQSPHSAVVTTAGETKKPQPDTTGVFPGSATPRASQGITSGTQYFDFKPDKQGTFVLLCGVPGHAVGGQWNYVKVVGPNAKPSITLGGKTSTVEAAG